MTITDLQRERALKIFTLKRRITDIHFVMQLVLSNNHHHERTTISRGELLNFTDADFILVAHDDFHAGERLCLRWHDLCLVIMANNRYESQIKDVCNRKNQEFHVTRLNFYRNASLSQRLRCCLYSTPNWNYLPQSSKSSENCRRTWSSSLSARSSKLWKPTWTPRVRFSKKFQLCFASYCSERTSFHFSLPEFSVRFKSRMLQDFLRYFDHRGLLRRRFLRVYNLPNVCTA